MYRYEYMYMYVYIYMYMYIPQVLPPARPPPPQANAPLTTKKKERRAKLKSVVTRITKKVTSTRLVRKAAERVSSIPLELTVEVKTLRGILAVNIPPPRSDTIWYDVHNYVHVYILSVCYIYVLFAWVVFLSFLLSYSNIRLVSVLSTCTSMYYTHITTTQELQTSKVAQFIAHNALCTCTCSCITHAGVVSATYM